MSQNPIVQIVMTFEAWIILVCILDPTFFEISQLTQ